MAAEVTLETMVGAWWQAGRHGAIAKSSHLISKMETERPGS